MKPSAYYDRVVDVMGELSKITLLMRGRTDYLTDRYSERNERAFKAINRQIEKLKPAATVQAPGYVINSLRRNCRQWPLKRERPLLRQ
jgi:hypothetical protein